MSLYSDTDLARLRRQRDTQPEVRAGWERFAARLRALDEPTLAAWEARRQELAARAAEHGGLKLFSLGNFIRSAVAQAPQLAFLWRVEGDEAARRAALRLCEFVFTLPEWRVQAVQNGWRSDLWTAEWCAHLGTTYLQLGDSLAPAERTRFRAIVWSRGIRPIIDDWLDPVRRIHALDSMGHNWWSVCVSGAALALFAFRREEPAADGLLSDIADAYLEFFGYPGNVLQNKHRTFGAQGDYIESVGYLDYALHDAVTMFDLFRRELDRDLAVELPVLARVCDYYAACVQPLHDRTQRLNFGNMGCGRDSVGSYNHQPAATWLWLARRFGRDDLSSLVRETHPEPDKLFEFLLWPEASSTTAPVARPTDAVFANVGVAVLRDGTGPTSTLFAIRAGEIWNHNQPDVGTFILSAAGREFFIDGGAMEYSNPRFWSYLRAAEGHNVILRGGQGPDDELGYHGTKFPGSIPVLLSAPGYRYVLADCGGPWVPVYRRFYRHVVWVDDFILLVDDLHAFGPGEWTQLWHYRGEATVDGAVVTIVNEGETLALHRVFPVDRADEFRTGFLPRMVGNELKYEYALDDVPYLATRCPDRGAREKFINVLLLPHHTPKQIRAISGTDCSGVEISDANGTWTFLCNHLADGRKMHHNADLIHGDLRTDAFIVGLHRDPAGRLDRFSLHNGSFLHRGERTLHSSLLKLDLVVALEAGGRIIDAHATASTRAHFHRDDGTMAHVQIGIGATRSECAP